MERSGYFAKREIFKIYQSAANQAGAVNVLTE
jgi:hypothetical protein